MNVATRFGKNLRRCRQRAGISQEEASDRADLHRTEIGLLERGERIPRIDTTIKLAAAVESRVEDLIEGIRWEVGSSTPGGFHDDEGKKGED